MTDHQDLRTLVEQIIDETGLVSHSDLARAIDELRQQAVSEYQLQQTNKALEKESHARAEHEKRLARLESDVQSIDNKVAQILTSMDTVTRQQRGYIDDFKAMRLEFSALMQLTETMLELSKSRQVATAQMSEMQGHHNELLNRLSEEGAQRAEELVKLEKMVISAQSSLAANQSRLEGIDKRLEDIESNLAPLTVVARIVGTKRMQSILITLALLMISNILNVDLGQLIETFAQVLGG